MKEINLEFIVDKEIWLNNFPELNIDNHDLIESTSIFEIDSILKIEAQKRIVKEGYFQIDPPNWDIGIKAMSGAVSKMAQVNMPTPMVFLFDEFWLIFKKLNKIANSILGEGHLRLPDFWAWHVDPAKQQSGWSPHRDKGYKSLNKDGTPQAITFWIPLSVSTPLNGCMYIVPAHKDKTYGTEHDTKWDFELNSIRALPAMPGTIFCWNQAVLHWGSQCSERGDQPRISVAMEFQSEHAAPFNKPLMDPLTIPNFDFRLKLIAKQLLQYQHMYPLSKDLQEMSMKLLKVNK